MVFSSCLILRTNVSNYNRVVLIMSSFLCLLSCMGHIIILTIIIFVTVYRLFIVNVNADGC